MKLQEKVENEHRDEFVLKHTENEESISVTFFFPLLLTHIYSHVFLLSVGMQAVETLYGFVPLQGAGVC